MLRQVDRNRTNAFDGHKSYQGVVLFLCLTKQTHDRIHRLSKFFHKLQPWHLNKRTQSQLGFLISFKDKAGFKAKHDCCIITGMRQKWTWGLSGTMSFSPHFSLLWSLWVSHGRQSNITEKNVQNTDPCCHNTRQQNTSVTLDSWRAYLLNWPYLRCPLQGELWREDEDPIFIIGPGACVDRNRLTPRPAPSNQFNL